jgi:hypothetical protein
MLLTKTIQSSVVPFAVQTVPASQALIVLGVLEKLVFAASMLKFAVNSVPLAFHAVALDPSAKVMAAPSSMPNCSAAAVFVQQLSHVMRKYLSL